MKYRIYFFIVGLFASLLSFAQEMQSNNVGEEDLIDIIYYNGFNNNTPGIYNIEEWRRDWNNPPWHNRLERALIEEKDGDQVLKLECDSGTFLLGADTDPIPGNGAQWWAPIKPGESYEELYLSYNVMFKPGYDFVLSGKLPGLLGGPNDGYGPPEYTDGFQACLAWNGTLYENSNIGSPVFYFYHLDQPIYTGEVHAWPDPYTSDKYYRFKTETEVWHNLTLRVVINTVNGPGELGNYDGLAEAYVDGKLYGTWSGLRLRNVESIGIDKMKFYYFYGGSGEEFAASRDEWALFDDFVVYKFKDGVNVPRGNVLSPPGRVVPVPYSKTNLPPVVIPPDTEKPSVPSGLLINAVSESQIFFRWNASTDNVGVTAYHVFLDGVFLNSITETSYTASGLSPNETYSLTVAAIDAKGNLSAQSEALQVNTKETYTDKDPPSVPAGLLVSAISDKFLTISWDESEDESGIAGYIIFQDTMELNFTDRTSYSVEDLTPGTSYSFFVQAMDAWENKSAFSDTLQVTTIAADISPPTVPRNLQALGVGANFITLGWSPSEDDRAVDKYLIYVNNQLRGESNSSPFSIEDLSSGFQYSIEVLAVDFASNQSAKSEVLLVSTKNNDITTAPKLPLVEILDVQNGEYGPKMISVLSQVGYTEVEDFGIVVSEDPESVTSVKIYPAIVPDYSKVERKGRVTGDLQVLYDFSQGTGHVIKDISGTGEPINLTRDDLNSKWLNGQGLKLTSSTSIHSEGSPERLISALTESNEITIEAWIKSSAIEQEGPARIISISSGNLSRGVTLGQVYANVRYNYSVRLNTSLASSNGLPEVESETDLTVLNLHHVIYTRSSGGVEQIYINGNLEYTGQRSGDFSTWDDDYLLYLGNESTGDRPWTGVFYLAAVYNRALGSDEISQNFEAGIGNVHYTNILDELEPDLSYYAAPYVRTVEGTVYGESREFVYQNVLHSTQDDSLYVAIYPNPSKGEFNVLLKKQDVSVNSGFIRIVDLSGKVRYHEDIIWTSDELEMEISLQLSSLLPSGIYSLLFVAGNMGTARKLLIYN